MVAKLAAVAWLAAAGAGSAPHWRPAVCQAALTVLGHVEVTQGCTRTHPSSLLYPLHPLHTR